MRNWGMLRIVPLYAAVLALVFVVLSVRVIRARAAEGIVLGTGPSRTLERRARVHANFAEYVPFALLLFVMAELRGASAVALHALCVVLLAARIAHAVGMSREPDIVALRVIGMAGTFAALVGGALAIALT